MLGLSSFKSKKGAKLRDGVQTRFSDSEKDQIYSLHLFSELSRACAGFKGTQTIDDDGGTKTTYEDKSPKRIGPKRPILADRGSGTDGEGAGVIAS